MDLSPEDLHEWMTRPVPRPFRLIDVREDDEFAICRLNGAELIPLRQLPEQVALRLAEKNQPVVVYCHHGMRSSHAAQWLRSCGYKEVYNLAGGIEAWADRIEPEMARY